MAVQVSPAFVLRRKPYRENGLLLDLYTESEGRITAIARFSKKQSTRLQGMLEPFRLLDASWTGRGDVFTMTQTEERGRYRLQQEALIQAVYMNELVLRAFQPLQADLELFALYRSTLKQLQHGAEMRLLMQFELAILQVCGYVFNLWHEDQEGEAIQPQRRYRFQPEQGLRHVDPTRDLLDPTDMVLSGHLLIGLREPLQLSLPLSRELRQVLDRLWRIILKGRTLYARALLTD